MTLIYAFGKFPRESLTVPPEAVRGLRYKCPRWLLFVSEPETMSVTKFSIRDETLIAAAYYLQDHPKPGTEKPLKPEDGEAFLRWLLVQDFVRVDQVATEGVPAMFPSFSATGPGLNPRITLPSLTP
jgi:hypothetical protein